MKMKSKDCSCKLCIQACKENPGWPTPAEAAKFIDDGLSKQLMLDWCEPCDQLKNNEKIFLLAPASIGSEGNYAPELPESDSFFSSFLIAQSWTKGRCVFLTKDQKCSVHSHKPLMCRMAMPCSHKNYNYVGSGYSNYDIAKLWDNDEGKSLVSKWKNIVKF